MQSRAVTLLVRSISAFLVLGPRPSRAEEADPPAAKRPASASAAIAAEPARTESLREQSSITGGTGLLHLQDPLGGAPGTFRLSLLLDTYKGSGFLCTAAAPCDGVDGDLAGHFGTTFGLALTPASFLETYASLDSYVNSNDARTPSLISAVGNTTFGVKGFTPDPVAGALRFGGALELGLLGNSGVVGLSGNGTSARLLALAQADFRGADRSGLPLRARVNLGYFWDNSASLVTGVERARGAPVTRIERFGLAINRVDQVELGLGVDGLFGVARPFAEWNLGVPLNRQGYRCYPHRSFSGDSCLATDTKLAGFPSRLTLGARFFPWLPGLSATAALDIGTTGTSHFIEELAPTMPWDLWLGVGYGFDAAPPPPLPVVREPAAPKVVALPPPPELRLRGLVHEPGKTEGIAKVIVTFDGREQSGMVTGADGHFTSQSLEPGAYTLLLEASGYEPGRCDATIERAAPPPNPTPSRPAPAPAGVGTSTAPVNGPRYTEVDCELEPVPPFGSLSGVVRDLVALTPVGGATARVRDGLGRELSVTTDASGTFRFEHVPPGTITLGLDAEGYLYRGSTADIVARAEVRLDVGLRRRPKPSHVTKTASELVLSSPIRFDEGATEPTADSAAVLEEVADWLVKAPSGRLEIQSYTDASGDAARDDALTERRAATLRDWLVAHGVDPARLATRGFGSSHPVSPNVTPAGRARNRRIKLAVSE